MVRFNKKGSQKAAKYHIGEIRKSQLISTFGIGSIVDFVKDTTIIGGVDDDSRFVKSRDDSPEFLAANHTDRHNIPVFPQQG